MVVLISGSLPPTRPNCLTNHVIHECGRLGLRSRSILDFSFGWMPRAFVSLSRSTDLSCHSARCSIALDTNCALGSLLLNVHLVLHEHSFRCLAILLIINVKMVYVSREAILNVLLLCGGRRLEAVSLRHQLQRIVVGPFMLTHLVEKSPIVCISSTTPSDKLLLALR